MHAMLTKPVILRFAAAVCETHKFAQSLTDYRVPQYLLILFPLYRCVSLLASLLCWVSLSRCGAIFVSV